MRLYNRHLETRATNQFVSGFEKGGGSRGARNWTDLTERNSVDARVLDSAAKEGRVGDVGQ